MKHFIALALILSAVGCNSKSAIKSSGVQSSTPLNTAVDSSRPETGVVCDISTFNERKPFFVKGLRDLKAGINCPKNSNPNKESKPCLTFHDVDLNAETYSPELMIIEGRTIPAITDIEKEKKFIEGVAAERNITVENEDKPGNPIVGYLYQLKLPTNSAGSGELLRANVYQFGRGLKGKVGKYDSFAKIDECHGSAMEAEAN